MLQLSWKSCDCDVTIIEVESGEWVLDGESKRIESAPSFIQMSPRSRGGWVICVTYEINRKRGEREVETLGLAI